MGLGLSRSPALRGKAKGERHVPAVEIDLFHRFLRADRPVDLLDGTSGSRAAWRAYWIWSAGVAFLLACSVRVA